MGYSQPKPAPQLEIFGRLEEAELYHSTRRRGQFSLLTKHPETGKMTQDSFYLSDMPVVLANVDRAQDTWMSQAEFHTSLRRVSNVSQIGLLFSDLDTYKTGMAGLSPDRQVQAVLFFCQEEGIPLPSLLVHSGRGLQAKWLLDSPLPAAALPRWNAAQRALCKKLEQMGADRQACDAARVLRLVDTVNTKSGTFCRVVDVQNDADGQPIRYSFDWLCDEYLLEFTREEMRALQEERAAAKEARKQNPNLKLIQGGWKKGDLHKFSDRQLAWHRLGDIRLLIQIRGGVEEGMRNITLFWMLNFFVLAGVTNSLQLPHEALSLAREIDPKWNWQSDGGVLSTLHRKAREYEAGHKIEFRGRTYPPLYTPRNSTLIEIFKITDEEQRLMKTIISKDLAKERHAAREMERRRAAGAIPRAEYLDAALTKREQALALRARGLSIRAIAQEMGVSKSTVDRYIAG